MPRVSILLTCYNHFAYLPTCWQGVVDQTYRDFEIIALDDGSTDGTRQWLSKREGEARIVLNEENLGTYATLNRGLEAANGEFVAILNDDDVWLPTKLEQQIALLERFPRVGLVHTDGYFIDGAGNRLEGSPLGFEFPRTESGDVFLDLAYQNKIIASAALVRRECFEELGGFDGSYFGSGDWQMWLRIAERWEIGYVGQPLTLYRVHGENASHKLERIWRDDQRLREWLAPKLDSATAYDAARLSRAKAHNWACLGTVRMLNGDPRGARAAFAASLREQPGRLKSALRWAATFLPRSAFRRLR